MERWTLAAHDDDRIVPHSVEERCSSLGTNLAPLRVIVGSLGRHFAHLMDDEYKHLNTVREHGGFHKALLEGRTLEHFHVYTKEGDASQRSVPPHVNNGAFLLLTKALDVPGTERSRFVLEDARGEMISPELSDDSVLLLMGDSMRRFLGADIQVLRHAMKKLGSGMRAWHGRMYLFPDEMHNDVGQTAALAAVVAKSGPVSICMNAASWDPYTSDDAVRRTQTSKGGRVRGRGGVRRDTPYPPPPACSHMLVSS